MHPPLNTLGSADSTGGADEEEAIARRRFPDMDTH
jgi:hypothetical protein